MPHHYFVTEEIPAIAAIKGLMPAVTDLEGFTYLQREGNGLLLGVYEERPTHWEVEGAPWDFGMTLLPPDIDRIAPELKLAHQRFPVLGDVGIRKWVHGAFTSTPDGNPLVGPVDGLPGYWAACGVFAGYSQSAGVGLVLANWIVDGDPGLDAFGMDVTRFGAYAAEDAYLLATTAQFYARRFVMAYPNEQLPAARPLKITPCYDAFTDLGARFTVNWGLEVPLYFAPDRDFAEVAAFGRSNAEPIVAEEVAAVRGAAGATEIAQYSRYEVSGPGAEAWLDHLLAGRIPAGRPDPADADARAGGPADGRPHRHPPRRRPVLADGLVLPPGLAHALVPETPAGLGGHADQPVRGDDGLLGLGPGVARHPRRPDRRGRLRPGLPVPDGRGRCGSDRRTPSSGASR